MTYREALTSAMQTWKTEDIVIGGEIVQKGGKEMLSMSFPYFIKNMAGILAGVVSSKSKYSVISDYCSEMYTVVQQCLSRCEPDVYFSDEHIAQGLADWLNSRKGERIHQLEKEKCENAED